MANENFQSQIKKPVSVSTHRPVTTTCHLFPFAKRNILKKLNDYIQQAMYYKNHAKMP
jgi:hypothetical protein